MDKISNKVFKLRVHTLYRSLPQVAIAAAALSSIVAFLLNQKNIWVWYGGYLVGSGYFLSLSFYFSKKLRRTEKASDLRMFLEHWRIQTLFLACMWATLIVLTVDLEPVQKVLIAFMLAGVTSGTSIATATFPNIARVYSSIVIFTFIGVHLFADFQLYAPIAGMTFLYWLLTVGMQQTLFKFFESNFELVIEHERAKQKIEDSQDMLIRTSRLATQAEMTTNLSQDLNGPLTVLFLHFYRAKQKLKNGDLDSPQLTQIVERCLQLAKKVQDIISMRKKYLYKNIEDEAPEPVDVQPVIAEILYFFEPKCFQQKVEFVFPEKITEQALCTEASLVQILSNLLNNALSAVHGQKEPRIELRVFYENEFLHFQVVDSGTGIAEQNRSRIFESFYSKGGQKKGLGMGLPVSRKIAEKFGGSLELEPGSPTTFTLKLRPYKEEQSSSIQDKVA